MSRTSVISLLSGAGGLDLGLEKAGFEVKVCIEKVQERCQTIKKNRPGWNPVCADISQLSTESCLGTYVSYHFPN